MAVTTKYGLFEFITLPCGLMTMPATYQWLIELVLSGLQWSLYLIYLDDVLLLSQDFDKQVDQLDKVLIWLGWSKVKGKQVCDLLHKGVLSKMRFLPDQENVAKILNWPVPKTMHQVMGILGLWSYYCNFTGISVTGCGHF